MTDRADVTRLRTRTGNTATLARRDLYRFWQTLDLSNPDAARDALLQFVPALVTTYGTIASSVAADWYETVRSRQVPGRYTAGTLEPDTGPAVGAVRYAAGRLYTDTPALVLPVLTGALQRHVTGAARATITTNAARDPARPRYARITDGRACAWCTLLSSRGFVYSSEDAAGGAGNDFHDYDGCAVVADWSNAPAIEGYQPGRLYDLYAQARDDPRYGGSDDRTIAAGMRRLRPDLYTDGVVTPSS